MDLQVWHPEATVRSTLSEGGKRNRASHYFGPNERVPLPLTQPCAIKGAGDVSPDVSPLLTPMTSPANPWTPARSTAIPAQVTLDEPQGKVLRPDLTRDEQWTLYKHAIDDRNFQVTLNWDRAKHYFVFNAALFSVAGGLSHLSGSYTAAIGGCLLLVALNALFAAYSIWKGHTYYRASRKRMKAIERQLFSDDLGAKTTRGMVRHAEHMTTVPLRDRLTITNLTILLQLYIAIAAAYAFARLLTG